MKVKELLIVKNYHKREMQNHQPATFQIYAQTRARESQCIYFKCRMILLVHFGMEGFGDTHAGSAPVLIVHTISLDNRRFVLRNGSSTHS